MYIQQSHSHSHDGRTVNSLAVETVFVLLLFILLIFLKDGTAVTAIGQRQVNTVDLMIWMEALLVAFKLPHCVICCFIITFGINHRYSL